MAWNDSLDCADVDCTYFATCHPCTVRLDPIEHACRDGLEDDCNGVTDCADADCVGASFCALCQPSEMRCGDRIDDDCDGATDCEDADCALVVVCSGCFPRENGSRSPLIRTQPSCVAASAPNKTQLTSVRF